MNNVFNKKQIEFMKKHNLNINFNNPTTNDVYQVENVLSKIIQTRGFDEDYHPTDECILCENILDILSKI